MIPFAVPSIISVIAGNPWARLAAVGVIAFGFGFVRGVAFVPHVDVAKVEANAIAGRDAHWQSKLAEQERKANADLAAAIEARDNTPPVPVADADLDRLCRANPKTCRDNRRSK
jgi:hypothetical protein